MHFIQTWHIHVFGPAEEPYCNMTLNPYNLVLTYFQFVKNVPVNKLMSDLNSVPLI